MKNKSSDLVGKRLSFHQLFNDHKYFVEIPTIQRDYAQGRTNKSEVRELFLQALYDYLNENTPDRDLDFVYGSTENEDGIIKFIPLDGQQRLTTLFLLHWYLATISGNIGKFKELLLHNEKSRFTYLTRPSSKEFVDALLNNEIDYNKLLDSTNSLDNVLSSTIKDKGWYYLSWSDDPTIQSMLTMLDAIHTKFCHRKDFYERLFNLTNPIITFQYLNLKEFSLTEDLYIKMNSRGKPLTSFENFKAKLEQHISELFGEIDKPFKISSNQIEATYRSYFSFQIDTKWADLFWQYRKLVGKPYTFDEEVMNFIRVIISNQFAIDNSSDLDSFKELIKNESATAEITENISYYKFKSLNALTKNCIIYIIHAFDALVNNNNEIKIYFDEKYYFDENESFEKALKYSLSLPERALFHAYIRYLIEHKSDRANFFQWMRVIRNLIENSRIEDPEHLISAIKSIEKLLKYSDDILKYLTNSKCSVDFFASWQIEEEILKAHLFNKSDSWKKAIENYEKQSFHRGQILYLFEFSGVFEYYKKNENVNWSPEMDFKYINSFINYANKSVALFRTEIEEHEECLLERALLTKGNYLIAASNNRFNFCSFKSVANYQRDFSWKRLLRFSNEDHWKTKRSFVKKLLDDSNFEQSDILNSLIKICKDVPDDWRSYFVQNSDLINYCGQGFIKIIDDDDIELYAASQQNHYHVDMYIYNLYLTHIYDNIETYEPFKNVEICPVKNSDEYSYAVLNEWCYKKKNYCIEIYMIEGKYTIEFKKASGNKSQIEFNEEIVDILSDKNFKWSQDILSFTISRKNEATTIKFLKDLCQELSKI